MDSKKQVEEVFTKTVSDWARFYADPKPKTMGAQNLVSRMRFALEMLETRIAPGAKVLDVGCGAGQAAGELMTRGYEAWGVDVSNAMVQYAREHYHADRFRVGDIERMDFPDNTFDGILCLGVVEYLDRDEPALREMWRVLKPGGWAVISTPNALCPFYYVDRASRKASLLKRSLRYGRRGKPLPPSASDELPALVHRRYQRRRWVKLLRSMQLEVEDWVCHSWGFYCLERFFDQGAFCRASDRFARNPALSWLASDQLACVRAVK
jgi:ubiquinone/menaquinone biosynthesis C-methylase UbiE